MAVLNFLLSVFLLPGDIVRRMLGINVEEDGGIIRSFVNMIFWGALLAFFTLRYMS